MNPTPALRATGGMLNMAAGQPANPQMNMAGAKPMNPSMGMVMGKPANPMAQKGTLIKKDGEQSDDLAETRRGRIIPVKGKKAIIKKVRQYDPEKRRKRRQAAYTPALGATSVGLAGAAAMPTKAKTKWEAEYNAAQARHEKANWAYEHHTTMHEMADPKARSGHAAARYKALNEMKTAQEEMHRLHSARASRLASASRNRRALAAGAAVAGAAAIGNEIQRRRSGRKSHQGWWNGS